MKIIIVNYPTKSISLYCWNCASVPFPLWPVHVYPTKYKKPSICGVQVTHTHTHTHYTHPVRRKKWIRKWPYSGCAHRIAFYQFSALPGLYRPTCLPPTMSVRVCIRVCVFYFMFQYKREEGITNATSSSLTRQYLKLSASNQVWY